MVIPQTPFSKPTLPVSPVFPGEQWGKVQDPSAHGWNPEELEAARRQAHAQGSAAVMVTDDGRVVANWGDTARRFRCHSIRKSLLSALYGIYVGEGRISLQSTLADLGIDDVNPSLTAEEKQARVRDLLMARSGVYHRAAGEVPAMDAMRPKAGSHAPGTFWHYNNWDFNALGTIFRERTALSIAEAFQKRIAGPIGMEDFRPAIRSWHGRRCRSTRSTRSACRRGTWRASACSTCAGADGTDERWCQSVGSRRARARTPLSVPR
jgi:CubicO group peptidase (beta-lactamase class C family)